jgi:hypothetical protein
MSNDVTICTNYGIQNHSVCNFIEKMMIIIKFNIIIMKKVLYIKVSIQKNLCDCSYIIEIEL